jgi:hypothetical protein
MRPPPFRPEQIEPIDAKVSSIDAKKVFRHYMLTMKLLDKTEVAAHVGYFAEEMRSHKQHLRDEVAHAKQEFGPYIAEAKAEIREIERALARSTEPSVKAELLDELDAATEDLALQSMWLQQAEREYRKFKEDKRAFLVAYINRQTQR